MGKRMGAEGLTYRIALVVAALLAALFLWTARAFGGELPEHAVAVWGGWWSCESGWIPKQGRCHPVEVGKQGFEMAAVEGPSESGSDEARSCPSGGCTRYYSTAGTNRYETSGGYYPLQTVTGWNYRPGGTWPYGGGELTRSDAPTRLTHVVLPWPW